MSDLTCSVAMTSYNGERYIKEQIDSILKQLSITDELVISDDGSTDTTLEILEAYKKLDDRVKIFRNSKMGAIKNFEFALKQCQNEIIFLSDQDDIWKEDKIEKVKVAFSESSSLLVMHEAQNFDENWLQSNLIRNFKHGVLSNLINSCYWGCCIAFRKELLRSVLPFPERLIAHDQWIGLMAEQQKTSLFIDEALILHRFHENNLTKRLPIWRKIKFRLNMLISYLRYKNSATRLEN